MISGIWRRLRSILPGRAEPARPAREPAAPPRPSFYEYDQPATLDRVPPDDRLPASPPEPTPPPAPVPPAQTPDQLAERLSLRLYEDESLRGELEDETAQPLLDWAYSRMEQLRTALADLPPILAAVRLAQAGTQLFELLRTVSLAVGGRSSASAELTYSRFQLLDTFLEPPLFPSDEAAGLARGRLEALLDHPPEWFQSAPSLELVRRLLDILG